jgi:hypothetical protein
MNQKLYVNFIKTPISSEGYNNTIIFISVMIMLKTQLL